MKNKFKLIRKQLENTVRTLTPLKKINRPSKGWVRSIRNALGMSARQLGARIGITQQRVTAIEKEELAGTLTLNTLERIAEATNTKLVYGFIPKDSFESTIKKQSLSYVLN